MRECEDSRPRKIRRDSDSKVLVETTGWMVEGLSGVPRTSIKDGA
jgi:hypothetical protein